MTILTRTPPARGAGRRPDDVWRPRPARPGARTASAPSHGGAVRQRLILAVTVFAVAYNALFALFAAQGGPATFGITVGIEVTVLVLALGIAVSAGMRSSDSTPLAYLYFTILMALIMSMASESAFVDSIRNVLIIVAFTMLGARSTEKTLRLVFTTCTVLTLAVLILEISALETYAAWFKPAEYLSKTRGYAIKEFYEEVGLSIGTIAYEGRFSFGLFEGPRTSSIFLEQVGINCFAIVLMVYLSTMWHAIGRWEKYLVLATIIVILVTNNARMASILAMAFLIGHRVFPKLPRYANIAIPAVMLLIVWAIFQFTTAPKSDDLLGRMGVTYRFFSARVSETDLLLGSKLLTRRTFDTGYGYIIASATIFGAFAYWAYLSVIVPQKSVMQRRCAWALATYIYCWLLVGGTASFSMKTASLLWFLIGFVRVQDQTEDLAVPEVLDRGREELRAKGN